MCYMIYWIISCWHKVLFKGKRKRDNNDPLPCYNACFWGGGGFFFVCFFLSFWGWGGGGGGNWNRVGHESFVGHGPSH